MIPTLSTMIVACLAVNLAVNSPNSITETIEPTTETTADSDLFDLDFSGGTLKEYVEAIRNKNRKANIVIMPDAMNIPMPPVQLKSVDLNSAMRILDNMVVGSDFQEVEISLRYVPGNSDLGELDIFTINASGRSLPVSTLVLSVSYILQGEVSDRDLLTTIESSLELVSEGQPEAKVQFHPETGILIVRGHVAQVELVSNLLDELNQAAARKQQIMAQDAAVKNKQQKDDAWLQQQEMIQQLSARVHQYERDVNRLRAELHQCETKRRALEREVIALRKNREKE